MNAMVKSWTPTRRCRELERYGVVKGVLATEFPSGEPFRNKPAVNLTGAKAEQRKLWTAWKIEFLVSA
jgi:hypothetical protein